MEELIEKIANNYETPTYVFDINTIKNRVDFFRKKFPKNVELCYAIKANTFVVKDIEEYVNRFEVCSNGEYEICRAKKVDENKILISGINKDAQLINKIIEESQVRLFSIESMSQFEAIKNQKEDVKIIIRITSGNQFGINENEAKDIIKNRNNYPNVEIVGLQYFTGTQKNSMKIYKKELEYMDDLISQIKDEYDFDIKELEYGTGFPVHYFDDDFDEEIFMNDFSEILSQLNFRGKIILEIGRSLVASSGMYLTKVVDKKINKDEGFAIVDGGINHLVYYGQFMAMKKPKMSIYPKRKENQKEVWNICGSLCTINDILVKKLELSDLKIGDILVFKNTGAYSMTEGISLFLSRDLPQILISDINNNIRKARNITPTYNLNM